MPIDGMVSIDLSVIVRCNIRHDKKAQLTQRECATAVHV